jgi:hypothetical protein
MNRSGDESPKPANLTGARCDFYFGAALLQKRGRFQCALTASHYEHSLSRKSLEFAMLGRVRR